MDGVTLTDGGFSSVTVAEADLVGSARLVAVTVIVCCGKPGVWVVGKGGDVYKPVGLIVPTPAGLIVHVTAVLLAFATLARNCCVVLPM